ncbi:MAG: hemolysin family protein [Firmicutes bacterium]|nr:hemolysin family protein [Bacillota bacterium]
MEASEIGLLLGIIGLLILSTMFSLCEISYSAANRIRLKTLETAGNQKAGKVLKVLENYDKALTAILIGNTIVTVAAASLATLLAISFVRYDTQAGLAASIASVALTLVLLVFCEISPKMIAKEKAESVAMGIYPFMMLLYFILWPLTEIFTFWKKLIKKVFRLKQNAAITDEELLTYVEEAESEGGIEKHEGNLIRSAIEFEDVDVVDIMMPRVEVIAVNIEDALKEIDDKFSKYEFSRMPVYSGSIDNIIGVVHERDFQHCIDGKKSLKSVLSKNINVPESMKISTVLRLMQKQKIHMAVVVDEHGGTSGIVTLEDILEELVGEIWDEHDEEEVLMKRVGDDSFVVDGSENLDDMFEALGIKTDREFDSQTVGGFVTEIMEKIPLKGEKCEFENLAITVLKADDKRVKEIKVKIMVPKEGE